MDRAASALIAGLIILGVVATSAAQQRPRPWGGRDCSEGTIERRLDCLTREIAEIRRRLDGHDGRIMPLGKGQ
jgi:hypothetical protein